MPMRYIIEHRARGTFKEFVNSGRDGEWKPSFSWACLRTDPKVKWWPDLEGAERELAKITPHAKGAYIVELDAKVWTRSSWRG